MPSTGPDPGRANGRLVRLGASALVLIALGVGAGWALRVLTQPVGNPLDDSATVYATVREGEVSSTIDLNAVATRVAIDSGANRAIGVVTAVSPTSSRPVRPGTVVYSVGLRPVVVAEGRIPSFRTLSSGVSGGDVRQLQRMLSDLGLYAGAPSGEVDPATVEAVRAWQRSTGVDPTGIVEPGDIIFLDALPSLIAVDPGIQPGQSLSGGENAVDALPEVPTFSIPATPAQASLMPVGTEVDISSLEAVWPARVSAQSTSADGQSVDVQLGPAGEESICAPDCGQIAVTGPTSLESEIVIVPRTEGLVVPSSALVTDAAGATQVVDGGGRRLAVQVRASARGLSIIEGVPQGTVVRLGGSS